MNGLKKLWVDLNSSLWFVPALLAAVALALALGLVQVDAYFDPRLRQGWPRLFGAEAEGSRGMLSAVAASMITVAGVTFSITIVALSLASSRYTPRVLRNFMRDRPNQIVLGVFVGIFTYCLTVLLAIRGGEGAFVPQLAVIFGVVLALVGIAFLIFFIHHIAASIGASSVIAAVCKDTIKAIDNLFPQELGEEGDEEEAEELTSAYQGMTWQPVRAARTGYIQNIDADALLCFAREVGTAVRMVRGVGEFIVEGTPLASVAQSAETGEEAVKALNDVYAIDSYRSIDQDAAFGVRQIVDIALKALSPGGNDTTTAVTCVEYLSAILARLARRRIEAPYRFDQVELMVIARGPTFEKLAAESFDQIRQNAGGNVAARRRMLGSIETIAHQTTNARRRRVLRHHVHLIAELAERSIKSGHDRAETAADVERVARALGEDSSTREFSVPRKEHV